MHDKFLILLFFVLLAHLHARADDFVIFDGKNLYQPPPPITQRNNHFRFVNTYVWVDGQNVYLGRARRMDAPNQGAWMRFGQGAWMLPVQLP
jgi:hypothetical protein